MLVCGTHIKVQFLSNLLDTTESISIRRRYRALRESVWATEIKSQSNMKLYHSRMRFFTNIMSIYPNFSAAMHTTAYHTDWAKYRRLVLTTFAWHAVRPHWSNSKDVFSFLIVFIFYFRHSRASSVTYNPNRWNCRCRCTVMDSVEQSLPLCHSRPSSVVQ